MSGGILVQIITKIFLHKLFLFKTNNKQVYRGMNFMWELSFFRFADLKKSYFILLVYYVSSSERCQFFNSFKYFKK